MVTIGDGTGGEKADRSTESIEEKRKHDPYYAGEPQTVKPKAIKVTVNDNAERG